MKNVSIKKIKEQLEAGMSREDITKERYIKKPFIENSIMYKTGDVCKFDRHGKLHYLGWELFC